MGATSGRRSLKCNSASERIKVVVSFTLTIIFLLLYLTFRRIDEALLILLAVPFALTGGFRLIWALGHAISVATAVGFIALAGVAAEFGVVMLVYLNGSWERRHGPGSHAAHYCAHGGRHGGDRTAVIDAGDSRGVWLLLMRRRLRRTENLDLLEPAPAS